MELLIEEEIKTYSYYSKGQEGEGPPCLGRRLTRLSPSAKIKVRECQLGTGPAQGCWPCHLTLYLTYFILTGVREGLCLNNRRMHWHCCSWGGSGPPAAFPDASRPHHSSSPPPWLYSGPIPTSLGSPHLPRSDLLPGPVPVSTSPTVCPGRLDK